MTYVQAAQASLVTGVTEHQLKEWCLRRGLLPPDVLPQGRGHNALFGWRTLLALRLLADLHRRFGGTVTHWGPVLSIWREHLNDVSFHALYGHYAVYDGLRMTVVAKLAPITNACLVLSLDEHLDALARGMQSSSREKQLPLLPPMLVKK